MRAGRQGDDMAVSNLVALVIPVMHLHLGVGDGFLRRRFGWGFCGRVSGCGRLVVEDDFRGLSTLRGHGDSLHVRAD